MNNFLSYSVAIGRFMVIVVPDSSDVSIFILPPCVSAISLAESFSTPVLSSSITSFPMKSLNDLASSIKNGFAKHFEIKHFNYKKEFEPASTMS